ncbi:MAG: ABC transporter ATP-binding protein [Nitrospira sp.]|nr:ABC transporter ATP-binding protein [Nitrospira sp.]
MSDGAATLEISALTSGYGEAIVIRGVSMTVAPGEIVALLGKNGMGKSTLLKTVMGFLPAREGKITLRGHDVTRDPPHRIARQAIAYTPQEQAIFQDLSVGDNLRLGQSEASWFEEELARVAQVFPFLKERLGQRAGTLSGGEQKMLLIARALMARPKLMLVDEITEGLQPSIIEQLTEALAVQRERTGVAMLLVEQNVRFALNVADRWAVLKLGEIDDAGKSDAHNAAARIADHLSV